MHLGNQLALPTSRMESVCFCSPTGVTFFPGLYMASYGKFSDSIRVTAYNCTRTCAWIIILCYLMSKIVDIGKKFTTI